MKRFAVFLLPFAAALMINGCASVDAGSKDAAFTAASFNVRVPRDKAPNDWKTRRVRLLSLLKEQRFDIFGVQEAVSMQIKDIKAAGYAMIGCGRDAERGGEYSAVFYKAKRFTCLESNTFWLSQTPDVPGSMSWKTACPRICTYGLFVDKLTGKKFVFVNTHLDHKSQEAKVRGSALILHKILPLIKKYPLIFTGDFNSRPDSVQISTIGKVLRDTRTAAEKLIPGPDMTFHAYNPKHPRRRHCPIDYIFVNNAVKVHSFQVIDDEKNGLHASDHYPLKAVVSL